MRVINKVVEIEIENWTCIEGKLAVISMDRCGVLAAGLQLIIKNILKNKSHHLEKSVNADFSTHFPIYIHLIKGAGILKTCFV